MRNKWFTVLAALALCQADAASEATPASSVTYAKATRTGAARQTTTPVTVAMSPARRAGLTLRPAAPVEITVPTACDWTQAAGDHDRSSCPESSGPRRVVERVPRLDPFVEDEIDDAEAFGWDRLYLARSATPLIVGDDVYLQQKLGPYTPCSSVGPVDPCGSNLWHEQTWGVDAYRWVDGHLVKQWERTSGWHPVGGDGLAQQWEPLFQPVIVGEFIYIPDTNGTVSKVHRATGLEVARIPSPLDGGTGDADTFVSSALSADATGNVFYTVMALVPRRPATDSPRNSWLVKVSPADVMTSATIASLTEPDPACVLAFRFTLFLNPPFETPLPWPPAPGAVGPTFSCGAMRPAVNAAPVPSRDGGTVFVLARTRQNSDHVWIDAVDSATLTKRWSVNLRDKLNDGCGVLTPATAVEGDIDNDFACKVGSTRGVDRQTGLKPGARALDLSIATPVELPDGGIVYGSYTPDDNERGHLMVLNSDGSFRWAFNFGWLQTPAIRRHDGTFDIVITNSHFNRAPFFTTALDPDGNTRWSTPNMNNLSCTRAGETATCRDIGLDNGAGQNNLDCISRPDGSTTCVRVTPGGGKFDFSSRTAFVGRDGTIWTSSSDGNVYNLAGATGAELSRVFVDSAQGASDVPISADRHGRLYVLQRGALAVLGPAEEQPR
jgi:outer membrane protein assembly factor BamB